jgi:choline dehydrogenase
MPDAKADDGFRLRDRRIGAAAAPSPPISRIAIAAAAARGRRREDSYTYDVPAFHALASEDEHCAWNFFVRHYADDARQRRDPKFRSAQNGVLYPRCSTLGGCTAHTP